MKCIVHNVTSTASRLWFPLPAVHPSDFRCHLELLARQGHGEIHTTNPMVIDCFGPEDVWIHETGRRMVDHECVTEWALSALTLGELWSSREPGLWMDPEAYLPKADQPTKVES